MHGHQVSFTRSWKMMTSEPGWYKPLIILALLSWVPILGKIATLGFAYEWARLAAWGVDGAPRRQGINYGKLLATGGWAYLVMITLALVCSLVFGILFGVDFKLFLPFEFGGVSSTLDNVFDNNHYYWYAFDAPRIIVAVVCEVIVGAFVLAAMMRCTLYDGFAAGWRLDRLCQMIGRDLGSFMRLVGVSAIGCALGIVYSWVSAIVVSAVATTGLSLIGWHEGALYLMFDSEYLLRRVFTLEPAVALVAVVFSAVLSFAGSFIAVAMQMVAVHATGMWFRRFDVARWGLSADPLPDGVPHDTDGV